MGFVQLQKFAHIIINLKAIKWKKNLTVKQQEKNFYFEEDALLFLQL